MKYCFLILAGLTLGCSNTKEEQAPSERLLDSCGGFKTTPLIIEKPF